MLMNLNIVRFKRNYDASEFILCLNGAQYKLIKGETEIDLAVSYTGFNSKVLFFDLCTIVQRTAITLPKLEAERLVNVINSGYPARLALAGIDESLKALRSP